MSRLRVAVIGVGYLGRFHAAKYAGIDGVELVAVVDRDAHQAAEVAREVGTRAVDDHRHLLGRVDAVSVVVPTPAHYAVARDFLEHGADVLIEKPITTRLDEADELIRIAAARGRFIQVGHLERFNPAVVALRERIAAVRFIESHRLSLFKPRCTDVSVVLDLMIHDLDLILHLVGSAVTEIRAAGISVVSPHLDIANARLAFANGCVANVTASRLATRNERKMRLFQPDAYLTIDFGNHTATVIRPDATAAADAGGLPGMHTERRTLDAGDALDDEIRSFVTAVRRRSVPEVTGEMGRDALRLALAIMDRIERDGPGPALETDGMRS